MNNEVPLVERLVHCAPAMVASTDRRRRQRGFSLIVVFLLIIVMVGIASTVMLSTQGDLQVAGHEREAATALYAAEAGVSWAEWWLYRFPITTSAKFSNTVLPVGAWSAMLNSVSPAVTNGFCVGAKVGQPPMLAPQAAAAAFAPGQPPPPGTPVLFDPNRGASYQWCVHNNVLDPLYALFNKNPLPPLPVECPTASACDSDSMVTVESWGFGPNGASAHITLDVSYFNPASRLVFTYGVGGGDERKGGGRGAESDPPPVAQAAQKGL